MPSGRIRDAVKRYERMWENVRLDKIIPVCDDRNVEKIPYIYSVITR